MKRIALVIALATAASGLPNQPLFATVAKKDQQRGSVINVEPLGVMSQAKLQKFAAALPGAITAKHAVELFRVTYWTVYKGKPTKASGLFGVPQSVSQPTGVMMYLQGTTNTRSLSPSQPNRADGDTDAAVFGGNGYYVVLPDYIGLGVSNDVHPYIITQPLVDDSIDMLKAVRQISKRRKLGWSPALNRFEELALKD